jgi:hypothetical protein
VDPKRWQLPRARRHGGTSALRAILLHWVLSRVRWTVEVPVLMSFGLAFLLLPDAALHVLDATSSAESMVLFRLFGAALLSRGLLRHAAFGLPEPRVLLRVLVADLTFALLCTAILLSAIRDGAAGAAAWGAVGLFVCEAAVQLSARVLLRDVVRPELERHRPSK